MNIEATLARLETLGTIIEILTEEYNELVEEVEEEFEFISSAIERGIVIHSSDEESLTDEEKMVDKANSLIAILKTFDKL
jgi:hypothetical protein